MIKGIIFDNDGVIVDNLPYHYQAFKHFAAKYGVVVDDRQLSELNGMGNDEIIPQLLPAEVIERCGLEHLSNQKESSYRQLFAPSMAPVKGLRDFLSKLHRAGILCAVGSSGPEINVEFVLDGCDIAHYFDVVINGQMVTHCKPDPEIYLLAADELGLQPSECLVFEDSFMGIKSAHNAQMKVVGVATTHTREVLAANSEPDFIIDDFTQIDLNRLKELFD